MTSVDILRKSNQLNISRDFIIQAFNLASVYLNNVERDFHRDIIQKKYKIYQDTMLARHNATTGCVAS